MTDSRPEAIHASIEGTLRRPRTDHVDLYYQHRIDPKVEPETVAEVRHPSTPRLEQGT
ncbi:aldo/keto reductase [Parolsenella catena]|uniref:aldo/keto reductase n=1 Tax=Parolsenella catena TaxID=2003188 RepID=UPI002E7672D1|nr:aldo/keto reductase [Parolsenella catena]